MGALEGSRSGGVDREMGPAWGKRGVVGREGWFGKGQCFVRSGLVGFRRRWLEAPRGFVGGGNPQATGEPGDWEIVRVLDYWCFC